MSNTESYRKQHAELEKLARAITRLLNPEELAKDASAVRSLLSQLMGKLNVHLTMEDKALYPSLLQSPKEEVRVLAKRYMDEMGAIGAAVKEYGKRWPGAIDVQQNPKDFIAQTEKIFEALTHRIDKENRELYVLADQV